MRGVPETAGWSMKVAAGKKYSVMACPVRNAAVPVSDGRSGVPGFVPVAAAVECPAAHRRAVAVKAECAPGRVWRLAYLFYRGGLSRESDCEKGCPLTGSLSILQAL